MEWTREGTDMIEHILLTLLMIAVFVLALRAR
jgi:hypothetical protein